MSWPWRPNTWEKGLRLQVSISSMVRSSVCRERKCTEGQPLIVGRVDCCTETILSSHSLTAKSEMKPPHDFPYNFPRAVIRFITADWLQISYVFLRLRCHRSCCYYSSADGRTVWRCFRAESTGKHSMNKAREREMESKWWEGEACCRGKLTPPMK